MFDIDYLDFTGNEAFNELLDSLFPGAKIKRSIIGDGFPSVRVYIPRCDDPEVSRNRVHPDAPPSKSKRTWEGSGSPRDDEPPPMPKDHFIRKPVDSPKWTETPSEPNPKPVAKPEPKSVLEMLEDGDERLKKLLGDIIDQKLDEREKAKEEPKPLKNDPSVFIANRLTFLIQTMFPIVFDTSSIETTGKGFMTIALNGDKTFPKINTIDELGYITAQINNSRALADEIDSFLDEDGVYSSIYCFPTTMVNRAGDEVFAVKFVCYSK